MDGAYPPSYSLHWFEYQPPSANMEPDQGSRKTIILSKGTSGGIHVSGREDNSPYRVLIVAHFGRLLPGGRPL